ncbi:unnamed protein product [Camellia sinensis]
MIGWLAKAAETSDSYVHGSYHIYVVLVGLFSSITGGISYCLTRAGAKASDQPVVTVFSFGVLASPASIICTFAFEVLLVGLHLEKQQALYQQVAERILCHHSFNESKRAYVVPQCVEELLKCFWPGSQGFC